MMSVSQHRFWKHRFWEHRFWQIPAVRVAR
jgi:hypothetical protein